MYYCPSCNSTDLTLGSSGYYCCNTCGAHNIVQYELNTTSIEEQIDNSDNHKLDKGKLQYSLIPPVALQALAKVLTYGAKKYAPNAWRSVPDAKRRYTDALYRHLEAWRSGEKLDPESKLPHIQHALANLAFLTYFDQKDTNGTN